MGLDWIPLPKAKPENDELFKEIFDILEKKKDQKRSSFKELQNKSREELIKLLNDSNISISPYETLNAPKVGFDKKADEWAIDIYNKKNEKYKNENTVEEFLKKIKGYYVLDLVPECNGLPMYVTMGEKYEFRAKFLDDCEDILGEDLMNEAYTNKSATETIDFGNRLIKVTDNYAINNNCQYLKNEYSIPENIKEGTPESNTHILYSAANWLLFWGNKGHGYQAHY